MNYDDIIISWSYRYIAFDIPVIVLMIYFDIIYIYMYRICNHSLSSCCWVRIVIPLCPWQGLVVWSLSHSAINLAEPKKWDVSVNPGFRLLIWRLYPRFTPHFLWWLWNRAGTPHSPPGSWTTNPTNSNWGYPIRLVALCRPESQWCPG